MLQGLVSQFQLMQLVPPRLEIAPFLRDILNEAADEKKEALLISMNPLTMVVWDISSLLSVALSR